MAVSVLRISGSFRISRFGFRISPEGPVGQPKPEPAVNRPDLLGVGALAAGGALLAASSDAVAGQPAPGAQVQDRGSSIRITGIRGLPAGTKAYVKIETNANITGWGEITGLEPRVACALAESL